MATFKNIFFSIVTTVLFLFILEGLASYYFHLKDGWKYPMMPEIVHTQYDELLGWVNIPNTELEQAYKNRVRVKINSQGFRNEKDFPLQVPPGKIRMICSGDSFTFGWDVSNRHAWPKQLETLDPRIEAVNMGQGNYGVDQAYLWYRRDGVKLDHDYHLFAFISNDFRRMRYSKQESVYDKPVLRLKEGEIEVTNVPVPHSPPWIRRFRVMLSFLGETSTYRLMRAIVLETGELLKKAFPASASAPSRKYEEIRPLAEKIFDELKQVNEEKESVFVLVYIPIFSELVWPSSEDQEFRFWLKEAARERSILLIDLTEDFARLPLRDLAASCPNHCTEKGYRFIAERIYANLPLTPR